MSRIGDYNLALVQCTIGNFRVTGWGPDDAVSIAPMGDLNESEVSADGTHVSVSKINDPRYEATLTVRRNTAAFRLLGDAIVTQDTAAQEGAVPALAFRVYDPISGDKYVERAMRFTRIPDMGFSKSQGNAEFKILLPFPTVTLGGNINTAA